MAVDDLGVIGVTVLKAKTQTPLIVYPNAPLPALVSLQGLQSVRWRYAHVIDTAGDVEHLKFPLRCRLKGAKPHRGPAAKQGLRVLTADAVKWLACRFHLPAAGRLGIAVPAEFAATL